MGLFEEFQGWGQLFSAVSWIVLFLPGCMMTSGLQDDSDAQDRQSIAQVGDLSSAGGTCAQKAIAAFGYPVNPSAPNRVYSYVRNNCGSCHGSTQMPKFSVADGAASYQASLALVNPTNLGSSLLYARSKDGHCGAGCAQDGTAILSALQFWMNAEAQLKVDPSCNGSGIKVRMNGSLLDVVSASSQVNQCNAFEIVSISNGAVAAPANDLDITLSGATVFLDAKCALDVVSTVRLPRTQASTMIYVMEAATGSQTLTGSIAGSSFKIDLTFTPAPQPSTPPVTNNAVACTTAQKQNAYKNTLWPVVKANCASCHTTGSRPQFGNATLSVAYPIARSRISLTTPTTSKMYTKGRDGHCNNCTTAMGATILSNINSWIPAETSTNCSSLGALVQ